MHVKYLATFVSRRLIMSAGSLVPRSSDKTYHSVEALLFLLLFTSPTQNQLSIWGDEVVAKYPNLTISKIKAWIAAKISSTFSNDDGVHQAVCNMDGLNDSLGGSSTVNCYCLTNDCCDTDDSDCQSGIDSGDDEKYVHLETKRDILYGIPDETGDLHKAMEYWQGREYAYEAWAKLEKRIGGTRPFTIVVSGIPSINYNSLTVRTPLLWRAMIDILLNLLYSTIRPQICNPMIPCGTTFLIWTA